MKENEDKEKEGELQFTLQGILFPYAALKFTCALWILFREARITIPSPFITIHIYTQSAELQ